MTDSWTAKFLFGSQGESDFQSFVDQIHEENTEFMSFQVQYLVIFFITDRLIHILQGSAEQQEDTTKVSFEQLSESRILNEVQINLHLLKSFENMLADRYHAYTMYFNSVGKSHMAFDTAEKSIVGGSLGFALDAFFVFIEQVYNSPLIMYKLFDPVEQCKEMQQAKQQSCLVDFKNSIIEAKNKCKKKASDYQVFFVNLRSMLL
jgi:hypothetical protein